MILLIQTIDPNSESKNFDSRARKIINVILEPKNNALHKHLINKHFLLA